MKNNTHRCIIDTVPGLVVEVDGNLIITLANREAYNRWPFITEGETRFHRLFFPDGPPPGDCIAQKTFKTRESQSTEIKTTEGSVFKIKTL